MEGDPSSNRRTNLDNYIGMSLACRRRDTYACPGFLIDVGARM